MNEQEAWKSQKDKFGEEGEKRKKIAKISFLAFDVRRSGAFHGYGVTEGFVQRAATLADSRGMSQKGSLLTPQSGRRTCWKNHE